MSASQLSSLQARFEVSNMWYWTSKLWPLVYIGISYIVLLGVWLLIGFAKPNHIEEEKRKRQWKNFGFIVFYATTKFVWGLIELIQNPQYFFILKGEDSESLLALGCFGFAVLTADTLVVATTKGINGRTLFEVYLHHVLTTVFYAYFIILGKYKAVVLVAMMNQFGQIFIFIKLLLKTYGLLKDSLTFQFMHLLTPVVYAVNKVVFIILVVWLFILHYHGLDMVEKVFLIGISCIVSVLNIYQSYRLIRDTYCPNKQPTEVRADA